MSYDDAAVVLVDLETTDLSPSAHIMQIGAKCGNREFNVYILPGRPISAGAAAVNGFARSGNCLYVEGRQVRPLALYEALSQFVAFVRGCTEEIKCVLLSHKASFDAPILLRALNKNGLYEDLEGTCQGFACSLDLISQTVNHYSYALGNLVKAFLPNHRFNLHNALHDVRAVDALIDNFQISDSEIVSSCESLSYYLNYY